MRLLGRLIFCFLFFGGIAWSAGIRFQLKAGHNASADIQKLTMKDGRVLTGRVLGEMGDSIVLEIEQGAELDLPKAEILQINKTASAGASIKTSGMSFVSYDEKKNYFVAAYKWAIQAFNILTYDNSSDKERSEHMKNLKAGYEWQLGGGRERSQQMLDMAARKSLGPYAKYMKGAASSDSSAPPAPSDRRS